MPVTCLRDASVSCQRHAFAYLNAQKIMKRRPHMLIALSQTRIQQRNVITSILAPWSLSSGQPLFPLEQPALIASNGQSQVSPSKRAGGRTRRPCPALGGFKIPAAHAAPRSQPPPHPSAPPVSHLRLRLSLLGKRQQLELMA